MKNMKNRLHDNKKTEKNINTDTKRTIEMKNRQKIANEQTDKANEQPTIGSQSVYNNIKMRS